MTPAQPAASPGRWRRALRWWQRPQVAILVLALLVADFFTLAPGYEYRQGGSRVANRIGSLRSPGLRRASTPSPSPGAYLAWYVDTDELRVVPRGHGQDATIFFDVYSSFSSEYSGWWGLTTENRGYYWTYDSRGGPNTPFPPGLQDRVNRAFVEHICAQGDQFWIEQAELATRVPGTIGYQETRVRWEGWARNAASISLWLAMLLSLGCLWRSARERRRWRLLARGICPECRYELGSLPREQPCPECGRPHPPRSAAQIRRPGIAARLWSRVRTPLGTLVLFLVLTADVLLLPKGNRERFTGSWIANHLPTPVIRRENGDGRSQDRLCLAAFIDNEQLVIQILGERWPADDDARQTIEFADGTRRNALAVGTVVDIQRDSYTRGFWAPVRLHVYCNYGGWYWERLPADLRSDFLERLAAWFDSQGMRAWAADSRQREKHAGFVDSTLWTGHAHNALAMATALAFLCSLAWIPERIARHRARLPSGSGANCRLCFAPVSGQGPCAVCGEPI